MAERWDLYGLTLGCMTGLLFVVLNSPHVNPYNVGGSMMVFGLIGRAVGDAFIPNTPPG